jgi:hypothetical protein
MSSQRPSDLLDLARDIPTTEEDARFLRENRPRSDASTFDQIQKLVDQIPNAQEILRRRPTLDGFEPFEL